MIAEYSKYAKQTEVKIFQQESKQIQTVDAAKENECAHDIYQKIVELLRYVIQQLRANTDQRMSSTC